MWDDSHLRILGTGNLAIIRIRHLAPHLLQLGGNRELRLMLQLLLSRRLRRPRTKR